MSDAEPATAPPPKTPARPQSGNPAVSSLKATPSAVGSAVMSDSIAMTGAQVPVVRSWIKRDIENEQQCEVDEMLKYLLYRCTDGSLSESGMAELFKTCLEAVLPFCNADPAAQKDDVAKKFIRDFTICTGEAATYAPFVKAANTALLQMRNIKISGIVPCGDDQLDDILLHHNDKSITQSHKGAESIRKPDVVVVSSRTALDANTNGDDVKPKKFNKDDKYKLYTDIASQKPNGEFKWPNVLSTIEFKHRQNRQLPPPPASYNAECDPPAKDYLGVRHAPPKPPAKKPVRSSNRLASKGGKKRTSDHLDSNEISSSKKLKINNAAQEDEKKNRHANVQNGLYAAEKFAAHVGLQHVLCSVVNDDMLYIWHIDRQKAIQSSGLNFVQDLPRFLVFLLIMQRLPHADWGYNPIFEPEGESCGDGWSPVINIEEQNPEQKQKQKKKPNRMVDLRFKMKERSTHYGLRGRATIILPVKSKELSSRLDKDSENDSKDLIGKLYWPEESREPEHEILAKVKGIAAENEKVKGHVPEMVWWHRFDETSTAKIRKALGMDDAEKGSRVLYIIVFRELMPITTLSGKEFLRAWWDAVQCHHALWKENIYHRDVSPPNIMIYQNKNKKIFGVLNDFDLSSTKDDPTGNERTGTIPFMALDLLTEEAIKGEVKHLYQHDAESFIWVLAWVCIQYNDGKLRTDEIPLDEWQKVDAVGCHKEKYAFLGSGRHKAELSPSTSHETNSALVESLLDILSALHGKRRTELNIDFVFQTWFGQVEAYL